MTPEMKITYANGFAMSRDFEDEVPRTRAGDIEHLLSMEAGGLSAAGQRARKKFALDEFPKVELRDGEVWLAEEQTCFGLELLHRENVPSALAVQWQVARAFVNERREPPQVPVMVDGRPRYERVMPTVNDHLLRRGEAGQVQISEEGALLLMLASAEASN